MNERYERIKEILKEMSGGIDQLRKTTEELKSFSADLYKLADGLQGADLILLEDAQYFLNDGISEAEVATKAYNKAWVDVYNARKLLDGKLS